MLGNFQLPDSCCLLEKRLNFGTVLCSERFSSLSVAKFCLLLSSFLMADRSGQHPPGMCNSPVYTAVDVAKNIRSPQAHKEWIVIMGAAAILKRWEDLGEGVDSN